MKVLALFLLKCYKYLVSPILEQLFGKACRYEVTCSEFALIEIEKKGILVGGRSAFNRFLHCNSWSSNRNHTI